MMMMMITLIWCTLSAVEMTTFGGDVTRVICSVSWRRLVNETAFNILRHRGYGEHQRDGEREQYGDERAGWSDRIRWRRSSPTASYDCRRSTHLLTYLLTYSQYDCRWVVCVTQQCTMRTPRNATRQQDRSVVFAGWRQRAPARRGNRTSSSSSSHEAQ